MLTLPENLEIATLGCAHRVEATGMCLRQTRDDARLAVLYGGAR